MPRRSFLIRHVRGGPLDAAAAGRYLRHWHTGDLYRSPGTFPHLDSPSLFGNDLPLEMEIGCSTGEFLCGLAALDPSTNYLGLDINLKSLHVAAQHASAAALQNVRFVKAPVQWLYPLMVPGSLRAVYLHFPDPALHPKYRKRRIYNTVFLEAMYNALVPEGKLSIVTDNTELFTELLALVGASPLFSTTHEEPYLLGYEPPVKSRYQRQWERYGKDIYRLDLRRTAVPGRGEPLP